MRCWHSFLHAAAIHLQLRWPLHLIAVQFIATFIQSACMPRLRSFAGI